MPGPYNTGKPHAGDHWRIPADVAAAMLDVTRAHRTGELSPDLSEQTAHDDLATIMVKNMTGDSVPLPQFFVVGLEEPVFSPDEGGTGLFAFWQMTAMTGVVPLLPKHAGRYAILQEPLGDQQIGVAAIAGATPVRLQVVAETDEYADIWNGYDIGLQTGPTGTARILWKQKGTGNLWGIVLLGNSHTGATFGSLKADWDVNTRPNFVTVYPANQDGSSIDNTQEVKVYLTWPDPGDGVPIPPTIPLKKDDLIPYLSLGADKDGKLQGAALTIPPRPLWGKVVAGWTDGNNFVMVRLCDESGTEIGYTPDVKCWLFSPESLASVKGVKLVGDDLIRIDTPKYDSATKDVIAHALNVYSEPPATHQKLLDGVVHNDTKAATATAGDIIYAHTDSGTDKWDRLPIQAQQSILYISGDGLPAWFTKAGVNGKVLKTEGGILAWGDAMVAQPLLDGTNHNDTSAAAPTSQDLIYATGSPAKWTRLPKGTETNASLSMNSAGNLAWQSFSLLDHSHHSDTSGSGNPPGHGSIIAGSDVLGGGQAWKELAAPATDGCPLVSASAEVAGVKWLAGADGTITVVTAVALNTGKYKNRTITVTKGIITAIGTESGWT
jgi:hypothetical protein